MHSLAELQKQATVAHDTKYTLKAWLSSADKVFDKAQFHRRVNQLEDAYVVYMKYCSIGLDIIPNHPELLAFKSRTDEYKEFQQRLALALKEAEELKKAIQQNIQNNEYNSVKKPHVDAADKKTVHQVYNSNAINMIKSQENIINAANLPVKRQNPPLNTSISLAEQIITLTHSSTKLALDNANGSGGGDGGTTTSFGQLAPQALHQLLKKEATTRKTSSLALPMTVDSVLLLDIRPRDVFLAGHIKAPAIVNIEPVILRQDMTASQLEASLEVSGTRAAEIFAARSNYTWIICYDQNTSSASAVSDPSSSLLAQLHRILSEDAFDRPLKHDPKWLIGGYDSWQRYVKQNNSIMMTQGAISEELEAACVAGDENGQVPVEVATSTFTSASTSASASTETNNADWLDQLTHPRDYQRNPNRIVQDLVKKIHRQQVISPTDSHSIRRSVYDFFITPQVQSMSDEYKAAPTAHPRETSVLTRKSHIRKPSQTSSSSVQPQNTTKLQPIESPFDNPFSGFTLTRSAGLATLTANQLDSTKSNDNQAELVYPEIPTSTTSTSTSTKPPVPQRPLPAVPSLALTSASSSELAVDNQTCPQETNRLLNSLLSKTSSPPAPPPTPMTPATAMTTTQIPLTPSTPRFAPQSTPAYLDNTPVYQSSLSDLGTLNTGVVGLRNLGNTCFMNSVIQCISSTSPLARYFLSGNYKRHINRDNPHGSQGQLSDQFTRLLRAIWEGQYNVISPVSFKEAICQKVTHFGGNDQQDAQEFLIFLLDVLHEDLNQWDKRSRPELELSDEAFEQLNDIHAEAIAWERYQMRHSSIIVSLMQGQLRSRLICKHCNMTSTTYSPFTFLSIPIPKKKGKCTLLSCMDEFTIEESLKGENAWNCPRCKKPRNATKRLNLARLPNVLIIHLKRFSFQGPFRDKLETMVDFPLGQLDIAKYVASGLRSSITSSTYNLYGVVNHYGGLNGGHYTACVKRAYDQRWYNYDDSRVSPCDESTLRSKAAYILFYVRSSVP